VSSAVDVAARALARRDRSETDVRRILADKGVSDADADEALERLRRSGALDDTRFARSRAAALADRGYGDAAIAFRLESEGIARELAAEAIDALAAEPERATTLAARRGATPRTARWLAARGFAPESVELALRRIAETDTRELG
jgi:regulatory protein